MSTSIEEKPGYKMMKFDISDIDNPVFISEELVDVHGRLVKDSSDSVLKKEFHKIFNEGNIEYCVEFVGNYNILDLMSADAFFTYFYADPLVSSMSKSREKEIESGKFNVLQLSEFTESENDERLKILRDFLTLIVYSVNRDELLGLMLERFKTHEGSEFTPIVFYIPFEVVKKELDIILQESL